MSDAFSLDGWTQEEIAQGYRINGRFKEYLPRVNGMPMHVHAAMVKRDKERKEQLTQSAAQKTAEMVSKSHYSFCPIRNHDAAACIFSECAMYNDAEQRCELAKGEPIAAVSGKKCPFSHVSHICGISCAMYNGGCTLSIGQEKSEK